MDESKKWQMLEEAKVRDYFAGAAIPGLMIQFANDHVTVSPDYLADACYEIADAMMKERASVRRDG